jgi:hypothetical protein
MSTKIIYNITKSLISILIQRGVDINQLIPKSKTQINFETESNNLIDLQGKISIIRAKIVDNQRELLGMIEPTLFNNLANTNNPWEKTSITKAWFDKVHAINNLVNEHEKLITDFGVVYDKIETLREYEI